MDVVDDLMTDSELIWHPTGATEALHIDVAAYFLAALGPPQQDEVVTPRQNALNSSNG